ncbi:hypothetical protein [Streptomyces sp. NPDC086777]
MMNKTGKYRQSGYQLVSVRLPLLVAGGRTDLRARELEGAARLRAAP